MVAFLLIFPYLRITLFGLILLVALIYCIPILRLRRYRYRNNLLTLNICLATILSSIYWFIFYLFLEIDRLRTVTFITAHCHWFLVVPVILTLQVPFSFVTASFNRLCVIVYPHKSSFKSTRWILICIFIQHLLCVVLPLPMLSEAMQVEKKIVRAKNERPLFRRSACRSNGKRFTSCYSSSSFQRRSF